MSGASKKNPPFAGLPKDLTINVRVLLGESTSTRRCKIWQTLGTLHTCDGNYPPTSPPNLNLHGPKTKLQEPPFVCFRLLRMKLWWKNWECNQPPLALQQVSLTQPWRCAAWADEISSFRFRFDPFRSGNGKKRRNWNMLLFLKKPIDDSSKQMQTTQEKTNFIHFICAEQKCANECLIVTMTFWHSFMGPKHRAPGLFEFP